MRSIRKPMRQKRKISLVVIFLLTLVVLLGAPKDVPIGSDNYLSVSAFDVHAQTGSLGTTINVTGLNDISANDGVCTLREAIQSANTNTAVGGCAAGFNEDIISLENLNGVIDLQTRLPAITESAVIRGAGSDLMTVRRASNATAAFRIFEIAPNIEVTISSMTISGGQDASGGAILNRGDLSIENSRLVGNAATSSGGAVYSTGTSLALSATELSGNTAGSSGGAVAVTNTDVFMVSSTLWGNTAGSSGGGAFFDQADVLIFNSTISTNEAISAGGGIYAANGVVELENTTLALNEAAQGGGLTTINGESVARNTILGANVGGDCFGTLRSGGYNLLQSLTNCTVTGMTTGNVTGQNPKLSPLANQGGFTLTHALAVGSPAIDAGSPSEPGIVIGDLTACLGTDQRGIDRGDTRCDIGAYEVIIQPPLPPPEQIVTASPFDGEGGVALTRETIFRFRDPINPASATLDAFRPTFSGQPLAARIHVSPDNRTVTLFYDSPLPASARIRVEVNGFMILNATGGQVDVDQDGEPGGELSLDFDTLSLTVVPGTSVCGRVFASELNEDNPNVGVNIPLQGVRITVDTMEHILNTTTNAAGNFCLDPAPAGRFFVHVDGRTATNSVPAGTYYPFVGKAWETEPGRQTNVGDIFLPLVPNGTLQPVSTNQDTEIHFSAAVLAEFPEFADVRIDVPANSLYADNGTRGGQVGIAPVPPDRLPGYLPPELDFPVVITVQTDGATNFDRPVPVCFPNLPTDTRPALPAGSKSALWSFNHDTGDFEVVGPMTVTDDAALVCTDPGVGVLAPGWHGSNPGGTGSGPGSPNGGGGPGDPPPPSPTPPPGTPPAGTPPPGTPPAQTPTAGPSPTPTCPEFGWREIMQTLWDAGSAALDCLKRFNKFAEIAKRLIDLADKFNKLAQDFKEVVAAGQNGNGGAAATIGVLATIKASLITIKMGFQQAESVSPWATAANIIGCFNSVLGALSTPCNHVLNSPEQCLPSWVRGGARKACNYLDIVRHALSNLEALISTLRASSISDAVIDGLIANIDNAITYLKNLPPSPLNDTRAGWDPELQAIFDEIDEGFSVLEDITPDVLEAASESAAAVEEFSNLLGESYIGTEGAVPNAYLLVEYDGFIQRLRSSASGGYRFFLAPDTTFSLSMFDPVSFDCGTHVGVSQPAGRITEISGPALGACSMPDTDADGLSDRAEEIIGTNANNIDTDGDLIDDATEVRQGSNPLDNLPVQTGIIATADTPGNAVDICITNDLAVVADSQAGVAAIYNIFAGMNPALIRTIDTPGNAYRVACDGVYAAVADGASGLAILDVSDPANIFITTQISFDSAVNAVAADAGLVYVGLSNGTVALVEIATGAILDTQTTTGAIHDLTVGNGYLYTITPGTLRTLQIMPDQLGSVVNSVSSSGNASSAGRNLRLFYAESILYVTHNRGYNTFNLANPAQPVLIAAGSTPQFGWKQIVTNGSGLGIAAVGANASNDGVHHVSVYNVSNPAQTNVFLTTFETPGIAEAVALYNGLAYVADGTAGMQVVNYQPFDITTIAPTITITSNVTGSVTEGSSVRLSAAVTDNAQVRNVEFYVDGVRVHSDGAFPFTYQFYAPLAPDTLAITARAIDTGGNVGSSNTINLTITQDTTPPTVSILEPAADDIITRDGDFIVKLTASDNVGIGGFSFLLNGTPVSATRLAFDTYRLGMPPQDSTYNLQVIAMDRGGLTTATPVLAVQVITLDAGDTITSAVNYAGDEDIYTFMAAPGQALYIDHLSAATNLRWSLRDSVNSLSDGWFDGDMGRWTLARGGRYTLRVYANGSNTGAYSFKLWGITDQSYAINVGDTISNNVPGAGAGNIETPGVYDTYTFSVPAGQQVFFDHISSASSLRWSLADGSSNTLFNGWFDADAGRYTLNRGGQYTLTIYGSNTATGTYSFRILPVAAPQTFNIAVGDTVSNNVPGAGAGNIEAPGVVDSYSFTVAPGTLVYFDHLSNATSLHWQLFDSAGISLFNGWMDADAGRYTLVRGGRYTLTVYGNGAAVGLYSFNLAAVPPDPTFNIGVGDTISNGVPRVGAGNIETLGVNDIYTFTVAPGEVVYFDHLSNAPSLRWQLFDNAGYSVFNGWLDADAGRYTLTRGGQYRLIVYGNGAATGTYSFRLSSVIDQNFTIELGNTVTPNNPVLGAGQLEMAGAYDTYAFYLPAAATVYFDERGQTASTGGTFYWQLLDPANGSVFNTAISNGDRNQALTLPGTYRLIVYDNNGYETGTYSFQIRTTVGTPTPSSTPNGGWVPSLTPTFTRTLTPSQTWTLTPIWSATPTPSATQTRTPSPTFSRTPTSTATPTFTATVTGTRTATATLGDQYFDIAVGDVVSVNQPAPGAGRIEAIGARDIYSFVAGRDQLIYFDYQGSSTANNLRWQLKDAANNQVFDGWLTDDAGRYTLLVGGQYTLTVYGSGNGVGTYQFQLLNVTHQRFIINIGNTVSPGNPGPGAGSIEQEGYQDSYTFIASPGQVIYFDHLANNGSLRWILTDDANNALFDTWLDSDAGRHTLLRGGQYTLRVYGSGSGIGTYSFRLWIPQGDQTFNIGVGDTVSLGLPDLGAGSIESAGVVDNYTFTVAPNQIVYFDHLADNGDLRWILRDAANNTVFNTWFDADAGRFTLQAGGKYTLTIYGNGAGMGNYSFRLLNVVDQTFAIALGNTVSQHNPLFGAGQLESPGVYDIYTFSVPAGVTVYFDERGQTNSNGGTFYWQLLQPNGTSIFNTAITNGDRTQAISQAGTYTLIIYDNNGYEVGTYSFQIRTTAQPPTPSNTPNGGWTPSHTPTMTHTLIPTQTWTRTPTGTLTNTPTPTHTRTPSPTFSHTPTPSSTWTFTPTVTGTRTPTLTAGDQFFDYVIGSVVRTNQPATGAGNIETSTSRDVYRFNAAPGQIVFFDYQGYTANGNLRWQLLDSSSTQLFDGWFSDDAGRWTLTLGGEYRLRVYGSGGAVGTYQFQVVTVQDENFIINVGDTVSVNNPAPGAGRIESPGVYDIYTFSVLPNQVVYFDYQGATTNGNLRWRLLDSGSTSIFDTWFNDDQGRRTLTGGTYRLFIYGSGSNIGTYQFKLWNVTDQTFPISIGSVVSLGSPGAGAGQIEAPGVYDVYTFTSTANNTVFFDGQGYTGDLRWVLYNPSNSVVFDRWFNQEGNVLLPAAGTYRLVVYGSGDSIGVYQFELFDVPAIHSRIIDVGDSIAASVEQAGEVDIYTFHAPAGTQLTLAVLSEFEGIRWRIEDAQNEAVLDDVDYAQSREIRGALTPMTVPLAQGGVYRVLVWGSRGTTGEYRFQIASVEGE